MQYTDHSKQVQWAICTAATPEEIDQVLKAEGYDGIEIDFKINGVKIDFTKFMETLDRILDRESKRMAADIATTLDVNKRFSRNALYKIKHELEYAQNDINRAIRELEYPDHAEDEEEE